MKILTYKYLFFVSLLTCVLSFWYLAHYFDDEFLNLPLKIKSKKDEIIIEAKVDNLVLENIVLQAENCPLQEDFPKKLSQGEKIILKNSCQAKSIEIESEDNIFRYNF